jgi:hypothetical protein
MSSVEPGARIRRVAVALDASPHALDGLALAAAIASALHAELEGIYVEDTELLRLAGLPFLRELRVATLCEGRLDADRLERELRVAGRGVRERLQRTATGLGLSWSFRVWRGALEAEILGAAGDAELFALGRLGRFAPLRRHPRPPRTRNSGLVVGVLCARADEIERLFTVAQEIADPRGGGLAVILQPETADAEIALRNRALEQLGPQRGMINLIALDHTRSEAMSTALQETVRSLGIDLIVLDAAHPLLGTASLWNNLEHLGCPILIGR